MNDIIYEKTHALILDFLQDSNEKFCFVIAASGTETGNTFLEKYCQDNTRALYMDLPSLELSSPKSISSKSILKCILQTLGVPNVNRTTSQLYEYLEIVLRNKDISHLIIDDIQEIKFSRHSFELFEYLRFFSKKFSVKFVCAGTEIPEFSSEVARHSRIQRVV